LLITQESLTEISNIEANPSFAVSVVGDRSSLRSSLPGNSGESDLKAL
jgi:hypothetical protein